MAKVGIGLSGLSGGTAKTWQEITLPSFFEDEIIWQCQCLFKYREKDEKSVRCYIVSLYPAINAIQKPLSEAQ